MGTVWEGRHNTLGTRVAIKFIDAEYADSPEARARFDNEARAAANIQSKHAIQIFDHGLTAEGKPYIVMELLVGEPLDQRLERFGRLPLAETARILRQVARALSRAHERGIVHRDLKPENIFLVRTPDDDEEVAKVLDFGIAKFKKVDGGAGVSGAGVSSSTKTGAVLGTPFYMAPEQARGLRDLDHRVDLWSIGVIAYKCVCGVLPFEGVSVGDLLVKICTTPAPVPSHTMPSLGPAFDAWFLRALEKEPGRRFQSAAELSEALAYAAGLSLKGGAVSLQPTSDPLAASAASNPTPYLQPRVNVSPSPFQGASSPNATSAPYTKSSPRSSSPSTGLIVGAAVTLTIGGGILLAALRPRGPAAATTTQVQQSGFVVPIVQSPPSTVLSAMPPASAVDAGAMTMGEPAEPSQAGKSSGRHHGHGAPPPSKGTPPSPALPPGAPVFTASPLPAAAATTPPAASSAAKPATKPVNELDPGY
jgi:serine/threonine-protein kinase